MNTRARPFGFVALLMAMIGCQVAFCMSSFAAAAADDAADASAARERAVGRAT